MAGSLNKAQLIGRVGKDPEMRANRQGEPIANFSLATGDSWKDRQTGERKESTEWHRIVVFNKNAADFCDKYLRKGDLVYVEGEIKTRKWQDQSGQDRYSTEIVVSQFRGQVTSLERANNGGGGNAGDAYEGDYGGGGNSTGRLRDRAQPERQVDPGLDDEIPF